MKTTNLLLTITAAGTSCGSHDHSHEGETAEATAAEESVQASEAAIDLAASSVNWTGEMLGMYAHSGTVSLSEASLSLEGDKISGGSFTVDLGTITPTDENYDIAAGNTPEKLVDHLSSADFFDVENHPSANFLITEVSEDG
ncbi:MAG: YceI family protein, partial [Flavobacteriales bacterium]|nr:YceI family protein [Flavobacteriales bacterium]